MSIKERLQQILDKSKQVELDFIESLNKEERDKVGDFEDWAPKDILAHVNFWPSLRIEQISTWLNGTEPRPIAPYEQSNLECFELYADKSWDEIVSFAQDTRDRLSSLIETLDDATLYGPTPDSGDRKLWDLIAQIGYSHKLLHYSEFYIQRGEPRSSGALWSDWAQLVSPLDTGEAWQGRVHYNAACGLALAGDRRGALEELGKGLRLQPGMKAWARLDQDLSILHGSKEFMQLIAADYWWEALEKNSQSGAVADQFIRTFTMLRVAVERFSAEAWLQGDTNYQRPAGIALHIAQAAAMFSAQKPGDSMDDALMQVNWENPDATKFPDQAGFLGFLDRVEEKLATFLKDADLEKAEDQFPWTGMTQLSRMLYALRHTQHHLADMAMELQRRGLRPPDWA